MRMIDFGPYFRSTVGFDRMFDMLENLPNREADDNYPPYNIEKTGEDTYRIIMAASMWLVVPMMLVFILGQRYFIKGVAMSGITGR